MDHTRNQRYERGTRNGSCSCYSSQCVGSIFIRYDQVSLQATTKLFTSLKIQLCKMKNKIWSFLVLINREWTPGTTASLPTQKDASGDHSHGRLSCCLSYLTSVLRKTAQDVCKSQTGQSHDTTAVSIHRTKVIVQQYSLNMERFIQNTRFVNSITLSVIDLSSCCTC